MRMDQAEDGGGKDWTRQKMRIDRGFTALTPKMETDHPSKELYQTQTSRIQTGI